MAKGFLYDNGDELITREDVNEVPDSSSAHAGDVLELDTNKKPKWSTPEGELPSTDSASEGDLLSLNSSKEPVWSAPRPSGIIPKVRVRRHASGSNIQYSFYDLDGAILSFGDCLEDLCDSDGNVLAYASANAISEEAPTVGEVVQFNIKENSSDNTKVDVTYNEYGEVTHSTGVSTVFFATSGTKTVAKAVNTVTPTTLKFTVADQA